eukprot:CAMPEP_0183431090 /NCGR_PEP_ID=MMETSP0370-20130417/54582_1 /TAXON_ID=268820 /ORGANISM="Peridinium aciculiferum, Strain PAER-2" /LENGTH=32 /DNA_ID= /DNA_START= /DNA_END= /DNA_ORIENTATION=
MGQIVGVNGLDGLEDFAHQNPRTCFAGTSHSR